MRPGNIFLTFLFLFIGNVLQAQYLTYNSDIKPIITRHCISCHQPGKVGAMPLTTYEEVSAYGKMIQYVISSKIMPPWYADTSYRHFSNERVLSKEEIETISMWVETDMKEGALPYGMAISSTVGVTVYPRDPDTIIFMAEPFEQYGIYMDQHQVFVLPTHLKEDKWIEGIEFVAGNERIVRHATVSVSPQGTFDSLDQWDPRYGYYSFGGVGQSAEQPFWYTWSPDQKTTYYPEGMGKFLPAYSELIVHIHYGPTGTPLKDRSHIQLYFAGDKIEKQIVTAPLIHTDDLTSDSFFIPANTKKTFHAQHVLKNDISLMSLTPQANLLCRSWEIFARVPGESLPVKLLKINDWNFNWKETYHFETPLALPSGTVIHALAHYDNTSDNPCNPVEKPIDVKEGVHLFSEQFSVYFEYTLDHSAP